MLFKPTQKQIITKQDISIVKVPKLSIPKLFSEKSQRTFRALRAFSDQDLQNRQQLDIQKEQQVVLSIENPKQCKIEVYKQLARANCEIRHLGRDRDHSLWHQISNNEKIRLSNLTSRETRTTTAEFKNDRFSVIQLHHRKQAFYKRHPVQIPEKKERKITIKHVLRFRQGQAYTTRQHSPISHDELPPQVPLMVKMSNFSSQSKLKKEIVCKQQDEFKEMMELFENRKMRAIAQDVQIRKQKADFEKIKQELKKTLHQIGRLNLTIEEAFTHQVFSQKPYQKPKSYEFIQAAKYGNLYLMKDLLKENKYLVYDFDYIYMTALHWACKRGHFEVVQFLIQGGSDIEFQDIIGRPALYFSLVGGSIETVTYLLDHKANPWSTSAVNYHTVCDEYDFPEALIELKRARKQYITMKMTPPRLRERIWKNLRNT